MSTIKDKYALNYSSPIDSVGIEETVVDIPLSPSSAGSATITGTVTTPSGTPIPGCTIKLFDQNGSPLAHTSCGNDGSYSFTNISAGNYSITAVKDGYIITAPTSFNLGDEETKTIVFTLSPEPTLQLCSIAGHVYTNGEEERVMLSNAQVTLLGSDDETYASTRSAEDGEYLFYGVEAGSYKLIAIKQGYTISSEISVTAENNTIKNIDILLNVDTQSNVGTIHGKITHEGVAVAGAFVGLYRVVDGVETLVRATKTNTQGVYMFGDVATGKYKVKSKQIN